MIPPWRSALFSSTAALLIARLLFPSDDPTPDALPRARPLTDLTYQSTPERLARGDQLMLAMRCAICHSERDTEVHGAPPVEGTEYAGGIIYEMGERYRLVAPNITPDVETGAGSWTDDMLGRAIREGIGHDGRALGYMPWSSFRSLSDEDLAAVVVALRAVPPVRNALAPRALPPEAVAEWNLMPQPLEQPVPSRELSDPVARGTYLIELADCMGCHTAWETPTNPGLFGGGNFIERPRLTSGGTFSSNLTPAPSGIPYYSEELFLRVMREGKVVARALDDSMPWAAYRHMSDEDLAAIYAALLTLRPVDHNVTNAEQPTPCAACGGEHGGGEWNRPMELAGIELSPERLVELVGAYRFPDGTVLDVQLEDGQLTSDDTGPLFPQEDGEFLSARFGAPLRFERDENGRVVRLVSVELSPWVGQRVVGQGVAER